MFDKSAERFPFKKNFIFLGSSSVSPMCSPALEAELEYARTHHERGILLFQRYGNVMHTCRAAAAELLRAAADDLSFVSNCAEGLSMIANGYPFENGDEIISYTAEYPSNHYPWLIQQRRGVTLKLLPDRNVFGFGSGERPVGWTMEDLEQLVTPKTRILALSHVQFASGFAADLEEVSNFCAARGIDLVIDAAQSLGAIPIDVGKLKVSALVASGWKWLLGPLGSGVMFTASSFRKRIAHTMTGPELMRQGDDYLNHSWDPLETGARFEYSTTPFSLTCALEAAIRENAVKYGVANIWSEVSRLSGIVEQCLDRSKCEPLLFPIKHRSGILSVIPKRPPADIVKDLLSRNVVVTARGGYLRIAPHYYLDDSEVARAVDIINSVL